jgi:hypothetical protein
MKCLAIIFILSGMQVMAGAVNAGELTRSLRPPVVPAADEQPVRAVPVWGLNKRLQQCLSEATANLNDIAGSPVSVGSAHFALNRRWGYLLRADFTRADVAPPAVNRIVCWQDGEIVAAKLAIAPLEPVEQTHPLAVPGIPRP